MAVVPPGSVLSDDAFAVAPPEPSQPLKPAETWLWVGKLKSVAHRLGEPGRAVCGKRTGGMVEAPGDARRCRTCERMTREEAGA